MCQLGHRKATATQLFFPSLLPSRVHAQADGIGLTLSGFEGTVPVVTLDPKGPTAFIALQQCCCTSVLIASIYTQVLQEGPTLLAICFLLWQADPCSVFWDMVIACIDGVELFEYYTRPSGCM